MKNLEPPRAGWVRRRIAILGALLLAFGGAVVHRAYTLQVRDRTMLRELAQDHYRNNIRLSPMRGTIYDRQGAELAVSVQVESVYANPRALRANGRDPAEVVRALAGVMPIDAGRVLARLESDRRFVWIARRVTPEQAAAVRALAVPGIDLTPEARRFYPNRELASHVLGFANIDGVGIEGLELAFEERLRGSTATVPAIVDRRGRIVYSEHLFDDRGHQGDDIVLTIDKTIQHIVERELALTVRTFEARAGSVVVMDPRSGEVLAMASYPTYNPNDPSRFDAPSRRNRAVTDRFEPGSTVKPFTIAAALDVGAVRSDELIDCENGAMQVAEYTIHDSHHYDTLTPAQILAFSSNIGTAKIASTLGRAGLYRGLHRFGFGQRTELPIPGENAGNLRHYRRWYEMDAATISFGQGMSTTTVQLATAMGALANGGLLMEPILVRRIVDANGRTVEEHLPTVRRRVVREDTARLVADMLTAVTGPGGTGVEAAIDGYLVAGKTGTAQKANEMGNGYAEDRWLASFVGFVPAEAPRLVIAVIIDEPVIAHYGGVVAGPVFRRVGEAALRHLGVPSNAGGRALVEHQRRERERGREARRVEREARQHAREQRELVRNEEAPPEIVTPTTPDAREVRVPNLIGATARRSVVRLAGDDLVPVLEGSGVVVSQEPAAGSIVPSGTTVRLVLSRPSIPEVAELAATVTQPSARAPSIDAQGTAVAARPASREVRR